MFKAISRDNGFDLALAVGLAIVLLAGPGLAQNQPSVSLETSETLFTVLTAINTCGYDQELEYFRSAARADPCGSCQGD